MIYGKNLPMNQLSSGSTSSSLHGGTLSAKDQLMQHKYRTSKKKYDSILPKVNSNGRAQLTSDHYGQRLLNDVGNSASLQFGGRMASKLNRNPYK